MDPVITSRQNKIVKFVRSLRDKRTREKEGLWTVEGLKSVTEALLSGIKPEKIIVSESLEHHPQVREIIAKTAGLSHIFRVSEEVMNYICETDSPQGLLALVRIPGLSLKDIRPSRSSLVVIIDGVQDPGNAGTIIRTADAFGAETVILTRGSADLYNSKTLRATMGSVFHLPVINGAGTEEIKSFLKENGFFTVATSPDHGAVPFDEAAVEWPLAVVFGSEARGVSTELLASADLLLTIPMVGSAESLNVAVAAGILLYEAAKRRRSSIK